MPRMGIGTVVTLEVLLSEKNLSVRSLSYTAPQRAVKVVSIFTKNFVGAAVLCRGGPALAPPWHLPLSCRSLDISSLLLPVSA